VNLTQAKSTLLVRAVELADRTGVLLPLAIRDRCTSEAQPPAATAMTDARGVKRPGELTVGEQAFVARRAGLIEAELLARSPVLAALGKGNGLGAAAIAAGGLAVLAAGFFSRHVWSDRPLHLLNFPLLWLIAWNFMVYVWLLGSPLLSRGVGRPPHPLVGLVAQGLTRLRLPGASKSLRPRDGADDSRTAIVAHAVVQFLRDWVPLQSRVVFVQAKVLLHGGALILTVGTAAGLLLRGFFHEYLAGWEATWRSFDAQQLHGLLRVFLGPASWLTGIRVPSLDEIAALRFVNGTGGGNAQDWILLYVAAAFLYVVVPRAGLLLLAMRQASTRRREFYFPAHDDRYYHRLLQAGRGTGEVAAVFWHGIAPTPEQRTRVRDALADELGGRVALEFMDPVVYGEESVVVQRLAAHAPHEHLVAVFSLAATPEEEVHGELLRQLAAAGAVDGERPPLVLLDAAPLERFAVAGGYRAHYDDRLQAWGRFTRDRHARLRVLEPSRTQPQSPGSAA
jgi:hypothetical protein